MIKNNYTLLFVEDDENIRKSYVYALKDSFREIFEAQDGIEAFEIYKDKKPDIMIVDVDLPKMNGIDLLKKIRLTDHNTKAIMLTSYSDTDILLEASSLKLIKYLVKPVQRKDFKDALRLAIKELENFTISSNKILNLKEKYSWSYENNTLYKNNEIINLTKKEKDILGVIFDNHLHNKKITTYEDLLYTLWDEYNDSSLKSLKTFMSAIRKKIPTNTIVNEYGVGFKLEI